MREINRIAHEEQPNFICLQETFVKNDNEIEDIKHMLNHTEIINTYMTKEDMGAMIISYGGDWDIINVKKGKRFIIIKISNGTCSYNLVNLHAPAVYDHLRGQFFDQIMENIILDRDKTIVLGDFNVVLDPIDRIGGKITV